MSDPTYDWTEVSVRVYNTSTGKLVKCWTVWRWCSQWYMQCARMVYPNDQLYDIRLAEETCG